MKKVTAIIAAIILTSCSTIMVHPKKGLAEFRRDKYDCNNYAVQYANSFGSPGNPFIIGPKESECLTIKHGWVAQ